MVLRSDTSPAIQIAVFPVLILVPPFCLPEVPGLDATRLTLAGRIATGAVSHIGGSEGFPIGCRSRHNFLQNIGRCFLPYKVMNLFPGRVLGKCRVQPEPVARSLTHRLWWRVAGGLYCWAWTIEPQQVRESLFLKIVEIFLPGLFFLKVVHRTVGSDGNECFALCCISPIAMAKENKKLFMGCPYVQAHGVCPTCTD
ncbi:hypothetical protein EVAR_17531_1 [Eumeta japonica]|uniref:Uncharacterized protein n=1 Tax=Eumeta variegata TaxID=151549 RepID=A0A4C1WPN2_EUMVA|nr:hypothetical protein EVAR_17531_1 [Eumeta japonica]